MAFFDVEIARSQPSVVEAPPQIPASQRLVELEAANEVAAVSRCSKCYSRS